MAMITLFCTMCLAGFVQSFFEVTPIDTLVLLGNTTQLNCTYKTNVSEYSAWYKGRGSDRGAITFGRGPAFEKGNFEVVDSKDEREYNLRLFNITSGDEDLYECGNTQTGQRAPAHVYVVDTGPNCTISGNTTAIAGEERTFVCRIDLNASAPGELVWIKDESELNRQEGQVNEWTTRLSKIDNNATFDCQLQHVTLPRWKLSDISCDEKVLIHVQYPPTVSIVVTSPDPLIEGDTFTARCTSIDANPAEIDDVYWRDPLGSKLAATEDLVLKNVTRKQRGEYTCVMTNIFYNGEEGYGTASVELRVLHPSPISSSSTIIAVAATSGAVLLVLVLVVVLVLHRRRRSKRRSESTLPSAVASSAAARNSAALADEGERYVICSTKDDDGDRSKSYQNVLEVSGLSSGQISNQNRVKNDTDTGLQNSTTKAELTYAELDLTDSGSGQQPFKRDPREKTEYAQIQIAKRKNRKRK